MKTSAAVFGMVFSGLSLIDTLTTMQLGPSHESNQLLRVLMLQNEIIILIVFKALIGIVPLLIVALALHLKVEDQWNLSWFTINVGILLMVSLYVFAAVNNLGIIASGIV